MKAVDKAGRPQYDTAKKLYANATELVTGGIDYRHTFVEFDKVAIDPVYTDGEAHTTCPAAIGVSMLAGTADGEGVGKQGVNCDNIGEVIPGLFCEMSTTSCQGVKPIALQLGDKKPYPWVPNILPFQVVRIGNVIIAAIPFELTTMSGRRIKATINQQLPSNQQNHVVLSPYANAYVQYITTNEEYQLQRYEGASTIFGPWALAALQQQYTQLTQALINGVTVAAGPTPPDLLGVQVNLQSGVLFDDKPLGKQFGSLQQDVIPNYARGEKVAAVFWGAHPKNNFRTQDTFLAIQQLINGQWQTIRTDRDWDTEYHWQRNGVANSLVTITWRTNQATQAGQYRIAQYGDWKAFWSGKISPYTGYSSAFTIS
jgi:neutral ceramidase